MSYAKLPYVHVEYPKWVCGKIVYSEDEELAVLEENTKPEDVVLEPARVEAQPPLPPPEVEAPVDQEVEAPPPKPVPKAAPTKRR